MYGIPYMLFVGLHSRYVWRYTWCTPIHDLRRNEGILQSIEEITARTQIGKRSSVQGSIELTNSRFISDHWGVCVFCCNIETDCGRCDISIPSTKN